MALSQREVFLVLRARDEATRVLRHFSGSLKDLDKQTVASAQKQIARGQALSSIGIGLAAAGAGASLFFKSAIDASVEYNRQAALTKTQTDKVQVSISQLKDIGRDLAATMPTDFDKVQAALYDIFSSIDVNLPQAKKLLHEFGMESVAGQEDLQKAGKGTIAVLNAFKIPVDQVRTVSDTMFQLVRKGVGTYADFNKTIGRAVPSAVRAGQSFQDLAGMMAFLTRNGLSAAMASASAGRALDAISNEKVVGRLEKMGIAVKNAKGEFLPMNVIMEQLGKKLQGLTAPERAKALNDLFKGAGGTIQARRFFDVAVKNFQQLTQYTDAMKNSRGAMQQAYDIMLKQPQSQAVLLANNFKILRTEVGDALLPTWLKLTGAVIKVLQWFNKLSPGTRDLIVKIVAASAVLAILAGIVLTVAGAFLIFAGAAALMEVPLIVVVGVMAGVVAAIIALGVALYFIIKYHKQIWAFMKKVWGDIRDFVVKVSSDVWGAVQRAWGSVVNFIVGIGRTIAGNVKDSWNQIVGNVKSSASQLAGIVKSIGQFFADVWHAIVGGVTTAIDAIVKAFHAVVSAVQTAISAVAKVWHGIIEAVSGPARAILSVLNSIWIRIYPILVLPFYIALRLIQNTWALIKLAFNAAKDWAISTWAKAWALIQQYIVGPAVRAWGQIKYYWSVIQAAFNAAKNWAASTFAKGWALVQKYIVDPLTKAWGWVKQRWTDIKTAFNAAMTWINNTWTKAWSAIQQHILDPITKAWGWVKQRWTDIKDAFTAAKNWLLSTWSRAWDALKAKITGPIDAAKKGITSILSGAKGGLQWVFTQAVAGIARTWDTLKEKAKAPVRFIVNTVLNGGLIAGFNWIANKFQAPTIKPIPLPKGFAAGGQFTGQLPGKPSAVDNMLGWAKNKAVGLASGEFIVNARSTAKYMPWLEAMNADHFAAGGIIGKAKKIGGGVIDTLKSAAGSALSGVKDLGSDVMGFLDKPVEWLKNKFAGPLDQMKQLGNSPVAQIVKSVPTKIAATILDKAKSLATGLLDFLPGGSRTLGGLPGGRRGAYGGVKPWVAAAGDLVNKLFPGIQGIGGVGGRPNISDHPLGLALDFMVGRNKSLGDRIASYMWANRDPLRLTYLIWYKKIASASHGWAWRPYTHPNGPTNNPTLNHMDHVHASFRASARNGMWRVLRDQMVNVHKDEMIVPSDTAGPIRRATAGAQGGNNQRPIDITIHTQELDPRRHAADLGWEITRRVS